MKYFVIFNLILFLLSPTFADVYLRDVPEGHWAFEAVCDLVKKGVISGFPDGIFRGKKNITRYAITAFLSKLARSLNTQSTRNVKLVEELKTELALIEYERNKAQRESNLTGFFESRTLVAPTGGKFDYRLKLHLTKNFDPTASLKINLDTMDAGFASFTSRDLTTELLDFEGRFRAFRMLVGPGIIEQRDSTGIFPSEDRKIFKRPFTALEVSGDSGNLDLLAAYLVRQVGSSGEIKVQEITGRLRYFFSKSLTLLVQPRYFSAVGGSDDLRGEVAFDFNPASNKKTYLFLGIGSFNAGTSGLHVQVIQEWKDLFGGGLAFTLRVDKIGSQYRMAGLNQDELCFLNNFDRAILDGTTDLGWKFSKKITERIIIGGKGDLSMTGSYKYGAGYPGTYLMEQISVIYNFSSRAKLNAFYRLYKVPSQINQYGEAVPERTTLLGISMQYGF